jgi:hypothetical protein
MTFRRLRRPRPSGPTDLDTTFEDVDVAISRTAPEHDGRPAVHEIEALYLAIIAATRRSLYIESQYFASRKIAEAIADRLREAGRAGNRGDQSRDRGRLARGRGDGILPRAAAGPDPEGGPSPAGFGSTPRSPRPERRSTCTPRSS